MERPYHGFSTVDLADGADRARGPAVYARALYPAWAERLAVLFFSAGMFLLTWRAARFGWSNFTYSDAFFLAAAAIQLVYARFNPLPLGRLSIAWYLGLSAMLGGLLIGSMVNGDPVRWFIVAPQYLFVFVLMPMVMAGIDERSLLRGMKLLVIGVALSQVIGIVAAQFFTFQDTYWVIDHGFLNPNGRIGALSGEPNLNGAANAFGLTALGYLAIRKEFPLKLVIPLGAAILAGLLVSASVTGFTAAAIGMAIVLSALGRGSLFRIGVPVLAVAICYLALGGPLPEAFQERVSAALVSGDISKAGTFAERTLLIREAWNLAGDNFFIGVGVDGYRHVSAYGIPVHNLYLLIINEGGILGFVGLLAMIGVLMAVAFGVWSENRLDGSICLALVAVFLIFSFAIPHMYTRMWGVPPFLGLAVAFASMRRAGTYSGSRPRA